MWRDYEAVVADYGLALYAPRGWILTGETFLLAYTPPEQLELKPTTMRRSDWQTMAWIMGCFAYEVLTDQLPFGKLAVGDNQRLFFHDSDTFLNRLPRTSNLRRLIPGLLQRDPRKRANFFDLAAAQGLQQSPAELPWSPGPKNVTEDERKLALAQRMGQSDASMPEKFLAIDFYYRYAHLLTAETAAEMYLLPLRSPRQLLKSWPIIEAVIASEEPVWIRSNFFFHGQQRPGPVGRDWISHRRPGGLERAQSADTNSAPDGNSKPGYPGRLSIGSAVPDLSSITWFYVIGDMLPRRRKRTTPQPGGPRIRHYLR